jgi:hypothetical protein
MEQNQFIETIESNITVENQGAILEAYEIKGEITRDWIFSLLAEGWNTYDIIKNYNIPENVILENVDLLEKDVIRGIDLSENFIEEALKINFFEPEDIGHLTMVTYSRLSEKFLGNWEKVINWDKMIIYISTQEDTFEKWIEIIDQKNLWKSISANDLNIDFIREWKDKLDWSLLSLVKEFTTEEKEEFKSYIISFDEEIIQTEQKEFSIDDIANLMDDIYGVNM